MNQWFSRTLGAVLLIGGVLGALCALGLNAPSEAGRLVRSPVYTKVYGWAPTPAGNAPGETPIETTQQVHSGVPKLSVILKTGTSVKQGEVLPIRLDLPDANSFGDVQMLSAKYLGKSIPLFPIQPNHYEGWMPVSVFQKVGSFPLMITDKQGRILATQAVSVADAHFRIQNITLTKTMGGLQPELGELETVAKLKTMVTWQKFWEGEFMSPTIDCQNSPFGNLRYHNGKPTDEYHKGVDLRSPLGRPIRAINDGKVVIARNYRLHGGTVGLDHGFGFSSIFIHMSQINVKPGQLVKKGDVIGKVGSTGFATGPHLHWGFFVNGMPVNPNQWVKSVPRC